MKKVVAFLLVLFIFVAPVTTFVKADVVIGDNDNTIINENATILGRKIALMESLSDLALSGVTEFTISNTNDIDDYLDYLWGEVNDAIESLSDGTGFTELSNDLKSKYFTNLVQYKEYVNNRGDYFAHFIQNPSTSLLTTYFANNIFGKHSTLHSNLSLNAFRSLSRYNEDDGGNIPPQPNNIQILLDFINKRDKTVANSFFFYDAVGVQGDTLVTSPPSDYSWVVTFSLSGLPTTFVGYTKDTPYIMPLPIQNLYINYINGEYVFTHSYSSQYQYVMRWGGNYSSVCRYVQSDDGLVGIGRSDRPSGTNSSSGTLEQVLNYIKDRYKNVNIYVDGSPISLVSYTPSPTLDIDGFLKIYGNDNPQQYELQPNTQIDYDQLYQVIYNAIRDNLPISQGDINYYDSHDTIYSPTIINNYGEEEGDESDLIDTILDYAVIPKFDTAIAQPMRSALTNGVVIMNTSITNVIPDEILLILGACFFLLLFAVVINRMIK